MSRVAKKLIQLPDSVRFSCVDNVMIVENGSKKLTQVLDANVDLLQSEQGISFEPKNKSPKACWAMAGTSRALLANMIYGVTEGFNVQ